MLGIGFVVLVSLLAVGYAQHNFRTVKAMPEGTGEMEEIALSIREGANSFLHEEYKVLIKTVLAITLVLGVFIQYSSAITFMWGIFMSGLAGYIGMKMSTYANVRVTNTARTTLNIGKTLKVALRGGSVMGLCVGAFSLIGIVVVFLVFDGQLQNVGAYTNWCNITFEPFSMTLSSYALGCSIVAMFNRVGGGIYTKAADMGADLVGKTEVDLPEDSPLNPGTIADAVGDNVGDTAGLGSDMKESYVGAIVSAIVLVIHFFTRGMAMGSPISESLFKKLYMYPIIFCAIGLLSCIVGLVYIFLKKDGEDPHKELNRATWISAGLTALINLIFTLFWFSGETFEGDLIFRIGSLSLYVSAVFGIVSGIAIGMIAEYYTSYDFKPTQGIAEASKDGPAITITRGLAVGMESTLASVFVLGVALMLAYFFSGLFGIAMAAVGMLSFVSITVSVDTYGPISDNAGGIAEMSELDEDVRKITDKLDAVGNTTAAIGKGFAIGSASYASVSLMISFLYAFSPIDSIVKLDLINPIVLAGAFIGAAIPFYFSGLLIRAVSTSAGQMVEEIRRQFREITGLKDGTSKPDYNKCITIATRGALKAMKEPAIISVAVPVASGFIMGPDFVSGILIGSMITAIMLAIFCGNAGGAWDNAKKLIESQGLKGTLQHAAAVVGDTVGDPLKDTDGPSLDILLKIMGVVSLIMVCIYQNYNLLSLIEMIF